MLSPLSSPWRGEPSEETIVDPKYVVGVVDWQVEQQVQEAIQGQTLHQVSCSCPTLLGLRYSLGDTSQK